MTNQARADSSALAVIPYEDNMKRIVLLVGTLIGLKWHAKGDKVDVDDKRAELLVKRKHAKLIGGADPPAETANETTTPNTDTTAGESWDGLGLGDKVVELLIEGGLSTPALARQFIADGKSLESLKGIGDKTAETIVAALGTSE